MIVFGRDDPCLEKSAELVLVFVQAGGKRHPEFQQRQQQQEWVLGVAAFEQAPGNVGAGGELEHACRQAVVLKMTAIQDATFGADYTHAQMKHDAVELACWKSKPCQIIRRRHAESHDTVL